MPSPRLTLRIVTPEKVSVEKEGVDSVIVPAYEGEYGILPEHAPAMLELSTGVLRVFEGTAVTPLAISKGFAEVREDVVSVFAETAEMQEEIDEARANQALERAKAAKKAPTKSMDLDHAEAAIKRALVRLRVAKMRKRPFSK